MEIAYTAHTETCTLLLDAGGICRSVLAASSNLKQGGRPTRIPASAEKCIGAQYVAALDVREPGGMLPLPQPGAQMLFARTEKNGRISLIRSAPVLHFEAMPVRRSESGVHERPDTSSATEVRGQQPTVNYGDDEELTIPCDPPRVSGDRRSSLPPPLRNSGVVPAGSKHSRMTPIPPPPRNPRVSEPPDSLTRPMHAAAPQPASAKRPSIVRVSAPSATDWEVETRPFKRAAR